MKKISHKSFKEFSLILLIIFGLLNNRQIVFSQDMNTIVADHTVVNQYDQIPQNWIDEVKKMLLCVPGESHGRGYIYGLELLEAQDSNYVVNATWEGEPETSTDQHLRIIRTYWTGSGWSGSGGEEDFWTNTEAITMMKNHLDYMRNTLSNPIDAFGFGWCWDMTWHNAATEAKDPVYNCGWAGSSVGGPQGDLPWGIDDEDSIITGNSVDLQNYLMAVDSYNSHHPQTKTFFSTGPVDSEAWSERGFQRDIKHQVIRDYVNDNGGVLFDYADILIHNNAGERYDYGSWNDHDVDYIHPENSGNYDGGNGACHIGEEGCLKLGKAMWWMLARIAGWDGNGGTVDLEEPKKQSSIYDHIKIYPNPSVGQITFETKNSDNKIFTIYDITGQQILSVETSKETLTIDNAKMTTGIYLYRVRSKTNDNIIGQGKFFIDGK